MNVFALGASKNIGYYSAIRLLSMTPPIPFPIDETNPVIDKGATVTFLLRNTTAFDTDETIQSYVRSGKARLVKGDALNIGDVTRGWTEAQAATDKQHVDFVLFTVGQCLSLGNLHDKHAHIVRQEPPHRASASSLAHTSPPRTSVVSPS